MEDQTLPQLLERWHRLESKLYAYHHAMSILNLDALTAAPAQSREGRGRTLEILSQVDYELTTGEETGRLLEDLKARESELDPVTRREAEVLRKEYDHVRKIPAEEYIRYQVLINDAQAAWEEAKNTDDFALFQPYLARIVDFNRKLAAWYEPEKEPYEVLLNLYEEGVTTAMLDDFFDQLRQVIVPLLEKIRQKPAIDSSFLNRPCPIAKQRALSDAVMQLLGLDRTRCAIAESEHPFTDGFNNKDLRITTHYHENNFTYSLYSVIHEGGHALYELDIDDRYNYTTLSGGVSMGIHESQSRFYENLIGRSRPFVHALYPTLQELLPEQMHGVTEEMLWKAVNKAEPSLIRTEADELTYCLHVMVRYQLEKELIGGTLTAAEVPARWNALYKAYLGIDVPSDREGCLQDSHWSGGAFGYFPSYALGSAYGAQFLAKMKADLGDIDADIARGDLSRVTGWLREHIHQYGSLKKPDALLREVVGGFDPGFYIRYLTEKYTELYEL